MRLTYKGVLILSAVLFIGVFVFYGIARHYVSTTTVVVNWENIDNAKIFIQGQTDDADSVASISSSGETIRLEKYKSYTVLYNAKDGYADNETSFYLGSSEKSLDIKPSYSNEKLSSILDSEKTSIDQVIKTQLGEPINNYTLESGRLLSLGEWYVTTLKYTGSDIFNNDTLRIVANKKTGTWEVSTSPPAILLSEINYPDIPIEVLAAANNL